MYRPATTLLLALSFVACARTSHAKSPRQHGAMSVRLAPNSLDGLVSLAKKHRALVLGETHRKREPAQLLLDLIPRLYLEAGYRYVAIEGNEDRQVQVEQYLSSAKGSEILLEGASEDDLLRRTLLHPMLADVVRLVRQLNTKHVNRPPIKVLLIDGPSSWNVSRLEQTRDQRMFAHLRRVYDLDSSARILVYVGNAHTTEGVQLLAGVEGPGHRFDAFTVQIYSVAHYLDLWLRGKSLSVRTVDPSDPIWATLRSYLGKSKRLFFKVDGTVLSGERGAVSPHGSWHEAIREAKLGAIVDYIVAFPSLTDAPVWPSR